MRAGSSATQLMRAVSQLDMIGGGLANVVAVQLKPGHDDV